MEDLEVKLNNKPNWKQWLPLYGIYQVTRDRYNGQPIILESSGMWEHKLGTYHITVGVGALVGLAGVISYVIDKI